MGALNSIGVCVCVFESCFSPSDSGILGCLCFFLRFPVVLFLIGFPTPVGLAALRLVQLNHMRGLGSLGSFVPFDLPLCE